MVEQGQTKVQENIGRTGCLNYSFITKSICVRDKLVFNIMSAATTVIVPSVADAMFRYTSSNGNRICVWYC